MHTLDLLEESLRLAEATGWQVRHEWLGGSAGGVCRLGKQHLLFVDRSLTITEQLEQVLHGLRSFLHQSHPDPFASRFAEQAAGFNLSSELKRCLGI